MTLAVKYPTLLDFARRSDNQGKVESTIAEMLAADNQILWDAPYMEGNLPVGNKTTRRSSLPTVAFRQINQGVAPTKSTSDQITDTSGFIEANAMVDVELARLNGNGPTWRFSEDQAFLEAMNQKMATTVFYGNTNETPEEFDGLAMRYAASSSTVTDPGYNVIKAGGSSTDNYSMWLCQWSERSGYLFYPKGTNAGFGSEDMGKQMVLDGSSNPFWAYVTNYKWHMGLTIRDWRSFVRIANIDASDLATVGNTSDTSPNLLKMMSQAIWRLPTNNMGNPVFYANSTVMAGLEYMILNHTNVFLTINDMINPVTGFKTTELRYRGIPIRRCDSLVTETTAIS